MKILIIDDHALFREGIMSLLRKRRPRDTVLEASTFEDASKVLQMNPKIGLVLLDFDLPGMSGLDALKKLHVQHQGVPVVILTGMLNLNIDEIFDAGAMGFIPKAYDFPSTWDAIQEVMAGRPYRPQIVDPKPTAVANRSAGETLRYLKDELRYTDIEIKIFCMLVKGVAIKIIASKLELKESTIKTYNSKIYASFGVRRRSELLGEIYTRRLSIDLS